MSRLDPSTREMVFIERSLPLVKPIDSSIIDQERNPNFYTSSYLIYITIAFVYAFFLALLVDRLLNYDDNVEKVCDVSNLTGQEYIDRNQVCRDAQKKYDSQKFVYMIIIGVLSIFGGIFLVKYDTDYTTGGMGVTLGGVALILYYTLANWSMLNRDLQVTVLGLTFFILFFGSLTIYKQI